MSECDGSEECVMGGGCRMVEGGRCSSSDGGDSSCDSPPPPLCASSGVAAAPPSSTEQQQPGGLSDDSTPVVRHVHKTSPLPLQLCRQDNLQQQPLSLATTATHLRHHRQHVLVHHTTVVANAVVVHAEDTDPDSPPALQPGEHQLFQHPDDDSHLSPSAHVNYKDEPLSVSVVHDDSHLDSHDSGLLSPSELSPRESQVSDPNMIDASDFRSLQPEPIYPNMSSMNGRMSPPGFSPSSASSYATLTPLQPLPPISTVSDKFVYGPPGNVSGSFTVMQNNGLGQMLSMGSPYQYDKMSMSPPHYISNNGLGITLSHQHSPLSPHGGYQNGLASPQKSLSPNGYDSPYTRQDMSRAALVGSQSPNLSPPVSLHSSPQAFTTFSAAGTPTLTTSSLNMNGMVGGSGLGSLSPQAVSPHSPAYSPHQSLHMPPSPPPPSIKTENLLQNSQLGCQISNISGPVLMNQSPPHAHMTAVSTMQQQGGMIHSCPVSAVPNMNMGNNMGLMKQSGMATTSGGGGGGGGGEVEEINTKDLAQRISAELKRYSIPQAIFAQRVLCRSQGTLSDLLRNPKPWSKLKSGRETFRRMWKWLQEPEFQRMSSLRLAVASLPQPPRDSTNAGYNSAGKATPRGRSFILVKFRDD
ncbi:homeobox protein onecut-like [Hyalella azteca]|uniref:Homeobox protein onecut-like n=1 Tax=Hyalella azteca TaxID=294128 RepID=A0A8B7NGP0_HYAAZ|nr:homeobox protein onecut-like [Hyalella azteca]